MRRAAGTIPLETAKAALNVKTSTDQGQHHCVLDAVPLRGVNRRRLDSKAISNQGWMARNPSVDEISTRPQSYAGPLCAARTCARAG
jgi:hypothetical protein